MTSIVVAVALAAGVAGSDPQVAQAGFWPGGGTAWSGTTSYYGFGREVPYGYGFGAEANAPRLGMMYPPRAGSDSRGIFGRATDDPAPRRRLLGDGPLLRRWR